jgi:protein-disulfide isomerase-like protein with CxxC motif
VATVKATTAANALPRIVAPWRQLASTGSTASVTVTRLTDPLCPWDYSFEPTMRTLESRYGDQLKLRTVVIGLVTGVEDQLARGYSPEHAALVGQRFGRLGMPFTPHIRDRAMASAPACRIVKAAGLQGEELAEAVLRALRLAWFNTPLLLDEIDSLEAVCERIDGLDVAQAIADLDSAPVEGAYLADRNEARSPSHVAISLRRAANTDGIERYTAPSLVLTDAQGKSMIVPGFQPFEAVDVAIVNLEPNLRRLPVPRLEELLALYPGGLTSQEIARVLADTTTPPDRLAGEAALAHLLATGHARRTPIGNDALWTTT